MINTEAKQQELCDLISPIFTKKVECSDTEFIGIIPSDPELLTLEYAAALKSLSGENESRLIHVIENPDNVFYKVYHIVIDILVGVLIVYHIIIFDY